MLAYAWIWIEPKKTIHIYYIQVPRALVDLGTRKGAIIKLHRVYIRALYIIYIYTCTSGVYVFHIYIWWRARFIYQWQGERCALPPASRTRGVESGGGGSGGGVSPLARALLCPRRRSVAAACTAVFPRGIAGGRPAETRCRLQNTGSPINRSHYKISYMKIYNIIHTIPH